MEATRRRERSARLGWCPQGLGLVFVCILVVAVPTATTAQSDEEFLATLHYEAADTCPDRPVFEDLVTVRMGYSPFREGVRRILHVLVVGDGGGYRGVVSADDDAERRPVDAGECDDVVEALAMLVALELDPIGLGAARYAEPPRAPLAPDLEQLSQEPPPPPEREEPVASIQAPTGPRFFATVALDAALNLLPSASLGGGLSAGLGWPHFELSLEALFGGTLVSRELEGAGLRATLWRIGIAPCFSSGGLRLCGLVQVGQIHARTDLAVTPNSGRAWTAFAGARVALVFGSSGFDWGVGLHALLPFVRVELAFADNVAWEAPTFAAGLSLFVSFGERRDGSAPLATSGGGD